MDIQQGTHGEFKTSRHKKQSVENNAAEAFFKKYPQSGYNPKISRRLMEAITGLSVTTLLKYEQEQLIHPTKTKYGGLEVATYTLDDVIAINRKRGSKGTTKRDAKIIAVNTQKGGTGKTFTATNIAAILSFAGGSIVNSDIKVLLVDLDSQGDVSIAMGLDGDGRTLEKVNEDADPTIADLIDWTLEDDRYPEDFRKLDPEEVIVKVSPTLDVIKGGLDIAEINYFLNRFGLKKRKIEGTDVMLPGELVVIKEALGKLRDQYDFIILDLPPNIETANVAALYASDYVISPIELEFKCLKVAARNEEFLNRLVSLTSGLPEEHRFNFKKVLFFPNKYGKQAVKVEALSELQKMYKSEHENLNIHLSGMIIPNSTIVENCNANRDPIILGASNFSKERRANSALAKDFTNMLWYIIHELLDVELDRLLFANDVEALKEGTVDV